jgi:histidinol-phosphate aminotransferase
MHPTPKPGIMDIAPYVAGKASTGSAPHNIKLSSNENPWGPSPLVKDAVKAASSRLHRYPDSSHAALREAISTAYDVLAENIICGAGSDEIINLLVHAYAGVGDEVLFSRHAFLMYKIYTLSNGATPIMVPEKNLTVDVDALLAGVTAHTKIVFLANPNNPTGTYIPFHEVQRLRDGLPAHVILALDAAYAEYMEITDYQSGHRLVESTNTVVMHTFSKIHGLPALRLGWGHAPTHIHDVLSRIRGPFNVGSIALAAGVTACSDGDYVAHIRAQNATERAHVTTTLGSLGFHVIPSHANFVLVHTGSAERAKALHSHLAQQGIMVRDVVAYGLPEYIRISIGTEDENNTLLEVIDHFVKASHAA